MKRDRSSLGISFKAAKPRQIHEIARAAGIRLEELRPYGSYKAKVSVSLLDRLKAKPSGRLICVSSMTPTDGGEGKTCTAIGLTQAMALLKKKVALCLREPSLGPLFGGSPVGTGAGYAQILPADEINLHFTGDAHATNAATNLLAAVIDNHRHRGNALDIDAGRVYWKRALDITESTPAFDLTAASEIMAILSLARSIADLKLRLSRILIGVTKKGEPVTAKDLKAVGAMAVLVKDAIEPNLVQTMESQPCLVHTGPSSLFSHGNNSILATEMALKLADYVVTESGYGTDMGLEKLFNIVSRSTSFQPAAVVIVVTAKALRNQSKDGSLKEGFENLEKHVQNVKAFGLEPVIAINRFPKDGEAEITFIVDYLRMRHIEAAVCNAVGQGGAGTIALAEAVMKVLKKEPEFKPLYGLELDPLEKCRIVARTIYGADDVVLTGTAKEDLELARRLGYAELPVSIAKTPFSLADDDTVKGVPHGWKLNIHSFRIWAGAGYLVAHAGKPSPASGAPFETLLEQIDLDENGQISGNPLEG